MSIIRLATDDDLQPLSHVLCELPLLLRYGQTPTRMEATLRSAMHKGDELWVFDADSSAAPPSPSPTALASPSAHRAPTGLAWFQTSGTMALGGYLRLLAVAPGKHSQGAGAALLARFEESTFVRSSHAFLLVSDFNTRAQAFYERHGYQRVGALPAAVLPEVSELIYWKRRPSSP